MISEYNQGNNQFRFHDKEIIKDKNIFTVIVGKNGTGKSRLLNEIINKFTIIKSGIYIEPDNNLFKTNIDLKTLHHPNKIITVSTSPYDKFPLTDYSTNIAYKKYYIYNGIRDLKTSNFSLGFMSKIINQLLLIRSTDNDQFIKIAKLLNYLGYSDEIHLSFEYKYNNKMLDALLKIDTSDNGSEIELEIILQKYHSSNDLSGFFRTRKNIFDINKLDKLKSILSRISNNKKGSFNITFNSTQIDSPLEIDEILFLLDASSIRLKEVELHKKDKNKRYKISESSSGEQCIFTTLIGISCNISDKSLILIDEPEISLHPEWQEKYIQLLIETFQHYKQCHFIIATHSPQLVSKLSTENCFILQMDNKELKNAKNYTNKSIDFQLVNIFSSPGFKNEYLSRIAFSIISKFSKNKKMDSEDIENYEIIKSQIKFLTSNDPIINLFKIIKELKQ